MIYRTISAVIFLAVLISGFIPELSINSIFSSAPGLVQSVTSEAWAGGGDQFICSTPWAPPECFIGDVTPSPPVSPLSTGAATGNPVNSGSTNFYVTYQATDNVLSIQNNLGGLSDTYMWVINPEDRASFFDPALPAWTDSLTIFQLSEGQYDFIGPFTNGLEKALIFGKYRVWVNLANEPKFADVGIPDDFGSANATIRIMSANPVRITYVTRRTLLATMARWTSSWENGVKTKGCYYVPLGITAEGITSRYLAEDTARLYFAVGVKCSDRGRWHTVDGKRQYTKPKMPSPQETYAHYGDGSMRSSLMLKTIPYEFSKADLKDYVFEQELEDPDPQSEETAFYTERYFALSNHLDISVPYLSSMDYRFSISNAVSGFYGLGPWHVSLPPVSGVTKTEDASLPDSIIEITDAGRIKEHLHLYTKIERRNDYAGNFYAYLLLDKDNDNLYEDIRYFPVENDRVDISFDFLAEDFPDETQQNSSFFGSNASGLNDDQTLNDQTVDKIFGAQTVNYSLEILDDNNMFVAGAGTGMNFNVYVPAPTTMPVGLQVSANVTDSSRLVIDYDIVWGARGVNYSIPVYLAVQQGQNNGVLFLVGRDGDLASALKLPLYTIDAGMGAGKKSGAITADIDMSGFWSFLYTGSYHVYLYYYDGIRFVAAQTAVNIK